MHTDQSKELRHIQDDKDIHTDQNKRIKAHTRRQTLAYRSKQKNKGTYKTINTYCVYRLVCAFILLF
jgi:hypothetical protein